MQPTRDIERYLAHLAPDLRDIVFELRGIIAAIAPTATETLHRKGLTYYHAERGGPVSAGICQINLQADHIHVAFIHGAFLPDPKGLLRGKSQYKRYVKIESFDQAPWDDLQTLIQASSEFDPRSLAG
ncbi:MAG: DUF1801 domain-containing protein [Chloroflexi bacterium]|nr:DUF1801 domain-containing protein [Chloroflexota bacterium]